MNFYTIKWKGTLPEDISYPCVILMDDNWNDYGYETYFHIFYYDSSGDMVNLGGTKILDRNEQCTVLPPRFELLADNFCSLGQEVDYYKQLKKMGQIGLDILNGINDVTCDDSFAEEFEELEGYRSSLLRFSGAQMGLQEGRRLFQGIESKKVRSFTFSTTLNGASDAHEVFFDFSRNKYLPYRINALIGKNGTGKTEILARLAKALSGYYENLADSQQESVFDNKPLFNKIIAISYSVFDDYEKPFENNPEDERSFNYVYCGMRMKEQENENELKRNKSRIRTLEEVKKNIFECYEKIKGLNREAVWRKILEQILEEEHKEVLASLDCYRERWPLSSGQSILLSTLTQVIANIENDSIILFDEPELHLHPNAMANLVRMLNLMLNNFRSFAIVSTHSPLIIQEIPSKYVRVFERLPDNTPIVTDLSEVGQECFGENVTNIVNDIFHVRSTESNYKVVLERLSKRLNYNEVVELFGGNLSFNALTYLNILYNKKGGGE